MSLVLEYDFENGRAVNDDGTLEGVVKDGAFEQVDSQVPDLGPITHALRFGSPGGHLEVPALNGLSKPMPAFTAELAFSPASGAAGRQNLMEGQATALALFIERVRTGVIVTASVNTSKGWRSVSSRPVPMEHDTWHSATLACTGDSVVLLVDGELSARRNLRGAALAPTGTGPFFLGTWVDGARYSFSGRLGLVRLHDEVPAHLIGRVVKAEATGLGEIDSRHSELAGMLGDPLGDEHGVPGGRYRQYKGGDLVWSMAHGCREVHGAIVEHYRKLGGPTGLLGLPVTDEEPGGRTGCKRNRFTGGWILWSSGTGAREVHGDILKHYIRLGGESSFLGLPISDELPEKGGRRSEFQGGTTYWSPATQAFEVHGGIRAAYLALGGPGGLGFPITDEADCHGGRVSRFAGGAAIYWHSSVGAFEVHGDIGKLYDEMGGPRSYLGWPISHEGGIGGTDVRFNDFQKGCITWTPAAKCAVHTSKTVRMVRLRSGHIDDGYTVDIPPSNDRSAELIAQATIAVNGQNRVDKRRPASGHGGTTLDMSGVSHTFGPIRHDTVVDITVSAHDYDAGSGNDWLGRFTIRLDAKNSWGLTSANQGQHNGTPLSERGGHAPRLNSLELDWSVGIDSPAPLPGPSFRKQGFWQFDNFSTPTLSERQYVETFSDVEHTDGTWEKLTHPWDTLYYELAYKGVASSGNCFGMSLEAAYAMTGRSTYFQPIHQYRSASGETEVDNNTVGEQFRSTFNRKQGYQLGGEAIDWFIGRVLSGSSLRPSQVLREVAECLRRRDWPALCMSDIEEGRGHCVFPYYVDGNRIYVADPNVPYVIDRPATHGGPTWIEVDPNKETFAFIGGGLDYKSGTWAEGVLPKVLLTVYPHHVLATRPRTPMYEVLMALLGMLGGIVVLAGEAEVTQVTSGARTLYDDKGRLRSSDLPGLVPVPLLGMPRRQPLGKAVLTDLGHLGPLLERSPAIKALSGRRRAPGLPRLLAARGALPDDASITVTGTGAGQYRTWLRGTQQMARLEGVTVGGRQDVLQLRQGAGMRGAAHVLSSADAVLGLGWGATGQDSAAPYGVFAELAVGKDATSSIGAAATGLGAVVNPSGRPRPVEVQLTTGTGKQSRTVRVPLAPGDATEAFEIRPADGASPLGQQQVQRLSGVGGHVIERILVDPLQR
jgi:hypothetical protein